MTNRSLVVIAVELHLIGPQFAPGQMHVTEFLWPTVRWRLFLAVFKKLQMNLYGFLNKQICIAF